MQRTDFTKSITITLIGLLVLLLGATSAVAQQVNLTAGPTSITLPDGSNVPMWGYSCGALASGSTATCAAANPAAVTTAATATAGAIMNGWSPVVITIPAGLNLQINLTNSLAITPAIGCPTAGCTATQNNNIPTSIVIVGQLGGGLGNSATSSASPTHQNYSTTWPIANTGPVFVPPAQGSRVQSFATEVAVGSTATSLTWTAPRPGTYLLESGTHPSIQAPMGLIGMVVVTCSPTDTTSGCTTGTAYPGVSYNADIPLLFSEIDAAQNNAVNTAVNTLGFSETATLGPYSKQPLTSVNLTSGGSGYTSNPTVTITGGGCSSACGSVTAVADTDPTSPTVGQVVTLNFTPGTGLFTSAPSIVFSGGGGNNAAADTALQAAISSTCSPATPDAARPAACYPPAVNYTPLYYLINGQAFDKTHSTNSLFATVPATGVTGTVLVRMVNAGLRMHVPAIVGAQIGTPTAVSGFSLIAEDGNPLPGVPRVQNEVFMAAGKTYDVMINAPQPTTSGTSTTPPAALPIYDRELSLSGNSSNRDSGMLAYIGVNGATAPSGLAGLGAAVARADTYNSVVPGKTLMVSDVAKGVIANDTNVFGVQVLAAPTGGTVALNANGTFSYTPNTGTTSDSFSYCANGTVTGAGCSSGISATVTLGAAPIEAMGGITCSAPSYTASNAVHIAVGTPGVLTGCTDAAGYPLTVATGTVAPGSLTVVPDVNGGFAATAPAAGTYTFTFQPQNSQGTLGAAVTATVIFPAGSGLTVKVLDGADHTTITDYRWIIEEDRTFYVDPNCTTTNSGSTTCPGFGPSNTPLVFGTNFHTSYMPVVATGCTGTLSCEGGQTLGGTQVVCDVGNGACRTDGTQQTQVLPGQVAACIAPTTTNPGITTNCIDPKKRYYISILPGDAANPFNAGYAGAPDCSATGKAAGNCGHGMGGAPIGTGQTAVTILTQPSPYPPAKLTVFVFEDDYPLNGEHDASGGVDTLATNEPGLGSFQITLFDDAGGTGDATGQPTYDMFNMPLTNSLAGTIDPISLLDACPISTQTTDNAINGDGSQKGIVGMIVTCPTFESDGVTLSPLAGQAVVNNLYQGRYGVMATPAADRIARGEEWLQTNTLDGQKAHDSFMRIGEPGYFQEFGPGGYHVTIGFANPKIINDRRAGLCPTAAACQSTLTGSVSTARMSRPPDERLYGSGSRDSFAFTQCYASLGDPDGGDFAFVKCDDSGAFNFTGLPSGNWKLTIFDQWNDQIVDGISAPVGLGCSNTAGGPCSGTSRTVNVNLGEVAVHQWQANIYTRTFIDSNGDGVSTKDRSGVPCTSTNPNVPPVCNPNYGNDVEGGLALASTNIRFRDGSYSNFNNTDLNGYAGFNEVFPLFNWYVIETDSTRYKTTGVHVVYDAGGPTDGTCTASTAQCGSSTIAANFANTYEANPLPTNLSVPGAVYCTGADCIGQSIANGPTPSSTTNHSSGRIDPPFWFGSYGWQGFSGQNSFLEFGKKPYAEATATTPAENGGIHGDVIYASTRPFDDPGLLIQTSWTPMVPHVTVNLYQEITAPDGSIGQKLVDTTQTSSFDDWAQGFHADPTNPAALVPNMNCPGQSNTDLFFFGLQNQPNYLDFYNNVLHGSATSATALPNNSQFKCYDGMHNWNQLQPAPYDGMYSFPSVTGFDPTTGKPSGTHCHMSKATEPWGCIHNPTHETVAAGSTAATDPGYDPYRAGLPMLPAGKYVVEIVVPTGFELVKEEDKNILIGDNYIAPVTSQFAGLGNIFILPDQAAVGATFNANNPQNATTDLGRSTLPSTESDTGSVEQFWPCVGEARTVPDFLSLFPQAQEVAPFAGATRNLCDRKEVTVQNQAGALAKFWLFSSAHIAAHFTGVITDDFTAEFDPFSPQFGEKFAPAYLPVSLKDWAGNEISRVYSDQWGAYTGLSYSTWEVNPPNPTGYGPTMMVTCMNDPGTGATPDPLYQSNYSQFCYELPFMPGQTGYFDTPVIPTSAFSEGYNHPDCNYPDATPAIASVTGDVAGPWVSAAGHSITITALGAQPVDNYGYSGPSSTAAPFNQKKVTRNYVFSSPTVTIGGVATSCSGSSTSLTCTVPTGVPNCAVQQQSQYQVDSLGASKLQPGASPTAQCGELLITNSNGQQSIDTVTVTIGGTTPTVLTTGTIQSAIDAAAPGDMIIVPGPRVYNEMLIMWKPVRLQGVGAASSIINANAHPAGKLDPWRKEIVCLFGLTVDGRPRPDLTDQSCATTAGLQYLPSSTAMFPALVVDRLPLEAVLGWDASLNGNLAEQLIEPSLMGAYEGAGITVLAKGANMPSGSTDPFGALAATIGAFPAGTTILSAADCGTTAGPNPYPSNFNCNPSSIDALSITNSSQGGGGIFAHGWAHNLQIANNRVRNNMGSLSGGISIGQGEHVDVTLAGTAPLTDPGSCETSTVANQSLPFCYDMNVNVHNNAVTLNSSLGDELFSSTPAGAGGVTFCNGADYYKFNYNWVCGNMSTGDGGGLVHLGFIKNGDIEHNSIIFNQSTNPTITTNAGGVLVMGAPDVDPPCSTNDQDCVANPPSSVSPSDGTGPGLVINANLILGNSADSGSGGGLRMQHINGTEVLNFPNGITACPQVGNPAVTCLWNSVNVTNNIIVNNIAGWDGGGVSLLDALAVNIINNTIASNDSTASSGALFGSLFAPLASAPPGAGAPINCSTATVERSCPQVAGLVSDTNSPILVANLPTTGFRCAPGHGSSGSSATCRGYSQPLLENDVIWQNRTYVVGFPAGANGFGTGNQNQQKVITLLNGLANTPASSQPITGACDTDARYWDIGVRGDTGPGNHAAGRTLTPIWSVLSSGNYTSNNNSGLDPTMVSQYCNGSRVPPENGSLGWQVPPGTNETNGLPHPVFTLTPSATVDEGNNWINLRWGPLSLTHPVSGAVLGNYALASSSPSIDHIQCASVTAAGCVPQAVPAGAAVAAPTTDFFGNPRPDPTTDGRIDVGAVENQHEPTIPQAPVLASINPASGLRGSVVPVVMNGTNLTGTTAATVCLTPPTTPPTACPASGGVTPTVTSINSNTVTANFAISSTAALGVRYVTVTTPAGQSNALQFTVVAVSGTLTPNPLRFGAQANSTTSAAMTVTFTNTTGLPITLRSGASTSLTNANGPAVGITGTNASNFAIVAGTNTTCTNGAVIAVSGTCVISVTFTQGTTQAVRNATLNIYAAGATASFATDPLSGGGAIVAFSGPTALTTPPPPSRAARSVVTTITNNGNISLVISSFTIAVNVTTPPQTNPGTFSVANTTGATACPIGGAGLAAGANCQITVTYTPPAAGSLGTISGTLTLNDTGALTTSQTRGYTGN